MVVVAPSKHFVQWLNSVACIALKIFILCKALKALKVILSHANMLRAVVNRSQNNNILTNVCGCMCFKQKSKEYLKMTSIKFCIIQAM